MKETRNILYGWRVLLWGGSVALLAWLFFQNLVPTGELVLTYGKESATSPISDLHPEQRIIELPEYGNSQRFFIDPVYFDAKVPREFDTVTVEMVWQNESQPILELGARKVRGSWGFVVKPLQNKILDDVLASSTQPPLNPPLNTRGEIAWVCERYDGVMFCQRTRRYANLSAFFSEPPSSRVLAYHYVLSKNIPHDVMNVNTDIAGYDYIIATYEPPEDLGDGWYRKRIAFDWSDFELYINELSFLISAPELNQGHGQIVVGDIMVILKRDPLDWKGLVEYIENQIRRLRK